MGLVNSRAPVAKTGQTTLSATGDDGDLEKGVAWPSPRFTDNGNGTVTDNLTGLIWLKNANADGVKTWANALSYCNSLASGLAGLSDGSVAGDWRLPNVKELHSLIDYGRWSCSQIQRNRPRPRVIPLAVCSRTTTGRVLPSRALRRSRGT